MHDYSGFDFRKIAENFKFEGEFINAEPCGFGHINDTFAVYFKKPDGCKHRYILQRINNTVFKDPEKLMENIEGVTNFLREKILEKGGDPRRETLNLVPSVSGGCFYKNEDGSFWRGYLFIEGAQAYQVVENPSHFYNAGKAFGKFQMLLGEYPADTLHETIPNFHNTEKRFEAFAEAVEKDVKNRAAGVKEEIAFAFKMRDDASVLVNNLKTGGLPLRVTHNDTKFNNVMIDNKTGNGICVIDLDTVMPGLSLYDFGDSIRFGTNPAAEDEKNLLKVWMDLGLFENFTRGFIEASEGGLTKSELYYMPFAAKIMTYECGIRFLTDYLSGDVYFKIHREEHNIDRARTQFKLVADMEAKLEKMEAVVTRYR